jgi:hypothetical protein
MRKGLLSYREEAFSFGDGLSGYFTGNSGHWK